MKKLRRRILVALPLALALITGAASTASANPPSSYIPCISCVAK